MLHDTEAVDKNGDSKNSSAYIWELDTEFQSEYRVDQFVKKYFPNFSSSVRTFDIDVFGSKVIDLPYDPKDLCLLTINVSRLFRCIQIMATNTVGMGWDVIAKSEYQKDYSLKEDIQREIIILRSFLNNCNSKYTFTEVMEQVQQDRESTGNGYIEVKRDLYGLPLALGYLPSHTVRLRSDGTFIQCRDGKKRYFKSWGDDRDIDANTGEVADLSDDKVVLATEVVHHKINSSISSWYGVPRWIPTMDAVYGTILAKKRNISFFENDATPRILILVHNGELSADSKSELKQIMQREGQGVENAHRVAVLEAKTTSKSYGTQQPPTTKIEIFPLTLGKIEDSSFQGYIERNNEEIRESFGIALPFFTSEGTNRSNASELKNISIREVFVPESKKIEDKLEKTLINALGLKYVKVKFNTPSEIDIHDQSLVDTRYAATGAYSINDMRQKIGLDPFEYEFASLPFNIALALFNKGMLNPPKEIEKFFKQLSDKNIAGDLPEGGKV